MTDFGKWWDDLKKHRKRVVHWLPHLTGVRKKFAGVREPRYFTLCARSMIDVFMLVKEGVLKLDKEGYQIPSVRFCEIDEEQFAEIKDIIAVESAGFLGALEDLLLFNDDAFTAQYPTSDSIAEALEDEGLQEDYAMIDRLLLKRAHLQVMESFPYDFMNLDFCDYYYPKPPDMLRINESVRRVLDWQRRRGDDDNVPAGVEVNDFILAVTCRHDEEGFPKEAQQRLAALVMDNCKKSEAYKQKVAATKGTMKIAEWVQKDSQDFFLAGWPKDIAHCAKELGWSMTVLDYVYYWRVGDSGKKYVMVCLVARFSRALAKPDYLPAALYVLDPGSRIQIGDIDVESPEGKKLLSNLSEIVKLRNEQARRKQVLELPDPKMGSS